MPDPIKDAQVNRIFVEDNEPRRLATDKHISHSQADTYIRCSWQWYLRYVKGLKSPPTLPLGIGKAGHAALEFNAKTKIATGLDLPLERLQDISSDLFDSHTEGTERAPDDLEPGRAKDAAMAGITHYRITQAPDLHPIAAEWEFNLDLNTMIETVEPLRIINGKIDVINTDSVRTGRTTRTEVTIEDHKFVSKKKSQADVDITRQLPIYDLAFEQATGKVPDNSGYRMFLPGTTKEPARAVPLLRSATEMTPEQRERRKDRIIHTFASVQRGIEAAVFIPTDDQRVCSWCGYRDLCQYNLVRDDFLAARIRSATPQPPGEKL